MTGIRLNAKNPTTKMSSIVTFSTPMVHISMPQISNRVNYESFDWKARAKKPMRMTPARMEQQKKLLNQLYVNLNALSKQKGIFWIGKQKIETERFPVLLSLYYILGAVTQCPETIASNPNLFSWVTSWANVISYTNADVIALKEIDHALYDYVVRRIAHYKASLKEYLELLNSWPR